MKKNKPLSFIEGILIGIILTCILFLILLFLIPINAEVSKQTPTEMENIIESCKNKSIDEASLTLNQIIQEIYIYNISRLGEEVSFNELLEGGGVCTHWSHFYSKIGEELGFNTIEPTFESSRNETLIKKHRVTIWSNQKGYVLLDGQQRFFVSFING